MAEMLRTHTSPGRPPLVPEVELRLANEITPLWEATEAWLGTHGISPPFWAFAWPGSQALARHVLDHPSLVVGRRVLDFGAGGGVAAIACVMSGAHAEAAEIDGLACEAMRLNADANQVTLVIRHEDLVGASCGWDLILCGDVCYEAPMVRHILPWLRRMAQQCTVWIADPGRNYLPQDGMEPFAEYLVPTSLELEDCMQRHVRLFRLLPGTNPAARG